MKENGREQVEDDDGELTIEERLGKELGDFYEQHMHEDLPLGPEVKFRIANNVKHVYSFRIDPDELDAIADAAEAAGQNVSDFIRQAAMTEVRRRKSGESAVEEVKRRAKELADAVQRL